jgi:hypothetical protein
MTAMMKVRKTNTSGHAGITFSKPHQAYLCRLSLGLYRNLHDAIAARETAVKDIVQKRVSLEAAISMAKRIR